MKQIYTKTGDGGVTSLRDGVRVPKDDIRIETNGQLDHLNSLLGVVRALLHSSVETHETEGEIDLLAAVQRELMTVMSLVATPDGAENPRTSNASDLTARMEQAIERRMRGRSMQFVLPGDTLPSAVIHVARTQARTCERWLWSLNRQYPVNGQVLRMMNRLSDYLFTLTLNDHD